MKSYFILQLKRLIRVFPFALTVAVILFLSLILILSGFIKANENAAENQIFKIGISGDTDNRFFDLGKSALQSLDSSRFSIEFIELTEREARTQLEQGKISAYVVIPDGFIEDAFVGKINPIKYVTTTGSVGLVSIFKNEITAVVEEMLVQSQKGVFGLENALDENGFEDISHKHINKLGIEYVDLIISRNDMYEVNILGISQGLSLSEYLICGITVFFLFIIGLPYVSVFVKKDMSLNRVMSAKGHSYIKQILLEFLAYFVTLVSIVLLIGMLVTAFDLALPSLIQAEFVKSLSLSSIAAYILPLIVLTTAFNVMIFEITSDIVSAVLLQFLAVISLCYISGCFYPIYSFPLVVQKTAPLLPMGAARIYFSGFITNEFSYKSFAAVIIYSFAFFAIAAIMRKFKISKRS